MTLSIPNSLLKNRFRNFEKNPPTGTILFPEYICYPSVASQVHRLTLCVVVHLWNISNWIKSIAVDSVTVVEKNRMWVTAICISCAF